LNSSNATPQKQFRNNCMGYALVIIFYDHFVLNGEMTFCMKT
jgi:hypothetical protein